MRDRGSDYFENSRQATYVQQVAYAVHNPLHPPATGTTGRGLATSPWLRVGHVSGARDYIARAPRSARTAPSPRGRSPPAVRPEIVVPTARNLTRMKLGGQERPYGFRCSFNQTFRTDDSTTGWVTPYQFGIDQGPVVLMIENYRSGSIWNLMRRCPYVVAGLRRAGFTGGWL
jgi:hypothetical protein